MNILPEEYEEESHFGNSLISPKRKEIPHTISSERQASKLASSPKHKTGGKEFGIELKPEKISEFYADNKTNKIDKQQSHEDLLDGLSDEEELFGHANHILEDSMELDEGGDILDLDLGN